MNTTGRKLFYEFGWWACRLLSLPLFRGHISGRENVPSSGGAVLLANHQSYLDPPVVGMALKRPCHFMARDSLFRIPLFGWMIRNFNAFPVKRESADVGALKETLRRLQAGQLVLVFPEGTRSTDGRIAPFKGGPLAVAQRAGVPIVPVVIEGTCDLWPKGRRLPRRGTYWVAFQPPITPQQFKGQTLETAAHELTMLLREQHNRLRHRIGRRSLNL